jgi:hypothetical protein
MNMLRLGLAFNFCWYTIYPVTCSLCKHFLYEILLLQGEFVIFDLSAES